MSLRLFKGRITEATPPKISKYAAKIMGSSQMSEAKKSSNLLKRVRAKKVTINVI